MSKESQKPIGKTTRLSDEKRQLRLNNQNSKDVSHFITLIHIGIKGEKLKECHASWWPYMVIIIRIRCVSLMSSFWWVWIFFFFFWKMDGGRLISMMWDSALPVTWQPLPKLNNRAGLLQQFVSGAPCRANIGSNCNRVCFHRERLGIQCSVI